ncbi:uncharacterized protein [Eucyclogobius newberryi]
MHLENSEPAKASGETVGEVAVRQRPADSRRGTESSGTCGRSAPGGRREYSDATNNNGLLTPDAREASGLSRGFDECERFEPREPGDNLSSASPRAPRREQHRDQSRQCEPDDPPLSFQTETSRLTAERENKEENSWDESEREEETPKEQLHEGRCHGTGSEEPLDPPDDFCEDFREDDETSGRGETSLEESTDGDKFSDQTFFTEEICLEDVNDGGSPEEYAFDTLEEISQGDGELLDSLEIDCDDEISTEDCDAVESETKEIEERSSCEMLDRFERDVEDSPTKDLETIETFERDSSFDEQESTEDAIEKQNIAENISTEDGHFELVAFSETAEVVEIEELEHSEDTGSVNVILCSEDDSSDCSSKSFKTCPEGGVPSVPCSDSSGVSEKSEQDDSSDEQTQWESFEEDEQVDEIVQNNAKTEQKKSVTDIVVEDFYDFFDRDDNHGNSQRQHYVSCFEGGDVDDRLHYEHRQTKAQNVKNNNDFEQVPETKEHETNLELEELCEENYETEELDEDYETEDFCEDVCEEEGVDADSDSDETEQPPDFYRDFIENGEDFPDSYLYEDYAEEKYSCEESDVNKNVLSAPCVEDISVEGDAYCDSSDASDSTADFEDQFCVGEDAAFSACSESEPYWTLWESVEEGDDSEGDVEEEDVEEDVEEENVEDYYAFEIRSVQTSSQQALRDFLSDAVLPSDVRGAFWTDSDGFIEGSVTDLAERLTQRSLQAAAAVAPPVGLIHSVPQLEESSGNSEDDGSEEETEECDCEYCDPPTGQGPVEPLLPELHSSDSGKMCVVIDLDETLVHSSFKPMNKADYVIPVEIEGTIHQVYVLKRPHVDQFLQRMGELFECVLFTASLSKYADPVSDLLDSSGAFRWRLFREACVFHRGNYVKDLSRLGRDLSRVIIIDNSPFSYVFHPDNAVPVVSWFDDVSDTELLDLIPFFESLSLEQEVYPALKQQPRPHSPDPA